MSRTERIKKLANAIKLYRGAYAADSGQWIRRPQPARRADVERHLRELHSIKWTDAEVNRLVAADLALVDGFKAKDEYEVWIQRLSKDYEPNY